jgi:ATP-binding cassette, subfamily B, bacterial HlyB/CyaB
LSGFPDKPVKLHQHALLALTALCGRRILLGPWGGRHLPVHRQIAIEAADLAWVFATLCGLLRRPFDARVFLQQFPPPSSLGQLDAAARALGLRLAAHAAVGVELCRHEAPSIAVRRPVNGGPLRLALILAADSQGVLIAERGTAPRSVAHAELATLVEGQMLRVSAEQKADAEADVSPSRGFGFAWFAAEIWKSRALLRDELQHQ